METKAEKITQMLSSILELSLSYNKISFLVFLLLFFAFFFAIKNKRGKQVIILTGNVIFYVWSGWAALFIVAVTSFIAFLAAKRVEKIYLKFDGTGQSAKEQTHSFAIYEKRAKFWSGLALVLIFGMWIIIKVCKLSGIPAAESFYEMIKGGGIVVPVGISYYTLSTVAYLMDVYWQKIPAERSYFRFFTAVTYFPHIVQGPICRYQNILEQMERLPVADYKRICFGLQLMLWGWMKKSIVADRLVLYTRSVFSDVAGYAGFEIFLAVVLDVIQLYTDFSGCVDVVRGISSVIGIELTDNFRQPFFAKNAADFWRRWHITLGGWTKEYIYFPIAMNGKFIKKGRFIKKKYGKSAGKIYASFFPLLAVWMFTGLWHGTGWDYLAWGMYWGLVIILSHITEDFCPSVCKRMHINTNRKYYKCWQKIKIFMLFAIGRMWTEVGGLDGCFLLWKQLFSEHRLWTIFDGSLYMHGLERKDLYVAGVGIIVMWIVDYAHEQNIHLREGIAKQPILLRWIVYYLAIFVVLIFGMYGMDFDAANFVYGNF